MHFLARKLAISTRGMVQILIMLGVGITGLVYIYSDDPSDPRGLACPVYTYLHFYCPGCGTTRALHQLLHGNFIVAFSYNPLMLVSIPLLIYMSVAQVLNQVVGWQLPRVFRTSTHINIVLAIILIYTVLRNIPLFPFTLLAPTVL